MKNIQIYIFVFSVRFLFEMENIENLITKINAVIDVIRDYRRINFGSYGIVEAAYTEIVGTRLHQRLSESGRIMDSERVESRPKKTRKRWSVEEISALETGIRNAVPIGELAQSLGKTVRQCQDRIKTGRKKSRLQISERSSSDVSFEDVRALDFSSTSSYLTN